MKLKKIASLALAGVMAVSMLAGCSTASNEPEQPTEPAVKTESTGTSSMLKDSLGTVVAKQFTFSDSTALNSALDKASTYVGGNEVSEDYTTPNGKVVAFVAYNSKTATSGKANAAKIVKEEMKAENADNKTTPKATLDPLKPTAANYEKDSLNVTLLFAVDGKIGYAAAMDQVADLMKDGLVNNVFHSYEGSSESAIDGVDTSIKYDYTISASATTVTLDGDHDKSVTLIAVNVARV